MTIGKKTASPSLAAAVLLGVGIANFALAARRARRLLLTATEVLEDVQGMPDQRLPDTLLAHAYGLP